MSNIKFKIIDTKRSKKCGLWLKEETVNRSKKGGYSIARPGFLKDCNKNTKGSRGKRVK